MEEALELLRGLLTGIDKLVIQAARIADSYESMLEEAVATRAVSEDMATTIRQQHARNSEWMT